MTKWDRKAKKVRWAKLVPVCWLIQGLLSATLRKNTISQKIQIYTNEIQILKFSTRITVGYAEKKYNITEDTNIYR